MAFLDEYKAHCDERAALGIPPLALNAEQVGQVVELLKSSGKDANLTDLLANRVNPGVDDAAKVKAEFLADIVSGAVKCESICAISALEMLGKMLGGYNVKPLISALSSSDKAVAQKAADELKSTLLVYDFFNDVVELSKTNEFAKGVLQSWADGEWFTKKSAVPEEIKLVVFKVPGETNTDDLSPAGEAHTRADIPMHATAMLRTKQPDGLKTIAELKKRGLPLVYVGDVVGTGSSRKSATNSVQWLIGSDIPGVPNKRTGGFVIGGVIAPIFFATCEDSGALPIQASDVTQMESGDEIVLNIAKGEITKNGAQIATFKITPNTLLDEVRSGGRVPLIIGRGLTAKARAALGLAPSTLFKSPEQPKDSGKGYSLAQKMVGKACGVAGIRPGSYCEPMTLTVGSQDTTGAMTRDEVKELASLGYSADLVMQSFCHTAAYPKPADVKLHATLPEFMSSRGGVALRPGDGVIHSWLNRMVLPDTVGTGGDSHTRFPIGVSFPAGSGLVAFAAVTGSMPLEMPESVLVRFKGELQPGITLRDLVNAIPYYAIKQGLLTVEKKGKKNIFNGKVLEIEGLPNLKVEQAFELSDASAERSAAACTVKLNKEPVIEYLKSNIVLLEAMIDAGYQNAKTLQRRADKMKEWIANPVLLDADADAEYACIIEIDLNDVKEPIVACPNDPDAVKLLSEVAGEKIDEVFLGSCMTNIGHYRAAGEVMRNEGKIAVERWWIVPPTKMDEKQLQNEGYYEIYNKVGARTEMPGCSLCMGNQAQTREGAVVFSTSTRNFDNRMGVNTRVYLGSAELACVCAKLGKIPTVAEYMSVVPAAVAGKEAEIYKYLNFSEITNYKLADRA